MICIYPTNKVKKITQINAKLANKRNKENH